MSNPASPNEGMISIGIPDDCPFTWLVKTLAKKDGKTIEFQGFSQEQLKANLKSQQCGPKLLPDLLKTIGTLLDPPINFTVTETADKFVLKV